MRQARWLLCAVLVGACAFAPAEEAPADRAAVGDGALGDGVLGDDFPSLHLGEIPFLERELAGGGAEGDPDSFLGGYDPKNGFHLRNGDDTFRIRFTGRLQARYTYKAMDSRGSEGGGRDLSTFELERARFGVRGHVLDSRFTYKIEFEAATDASDKGRLTDAYVYIKEILGEGNKHLNVGVGQWKPPFMRQEKNSSARLQFVDRSLTNEFFNIDRNIGVWIDGSRGPLEWAAALTNGFDSVNVNPKNTDHSPGLIARLDYNILRDGDKNLKFEESDTKHTKSPAWVVGAAFAHDANNGTGAPAPEFKVYTAEIDTTFKYMGMSLQAEYVARWLKYETAPSNGPAVTVGDTIFAHGFYAQAGYFLVPSTYEVALRASAIWNDGGVSNGAAVEIGPVFNWFISRDHRIKFQIDAAYVDIPDNLQQSTESLYRDRTFSSSALGLAGGDQGVITRAQLQFSW
ncbi:MAG: porin [Planctomycetota bacterium]|nr:porin [Planctomycetota bacterium]